MSAAARWGIAALLLAIIAVALYVAGIWSGDSRWAYTGVVVTIFGGIVGVVGASKSDAW